MFNLDLKYSHNLKRSILDVKIVSANLIRDTEAIGKMDPFVTIELAKQKKRTSVKDEAGKTPVWDEVYSLPVMNPNDPLKLTVLDEDVTTDDIVGSASVDLHEKGLLDASGWK